MSEPQATLRWFDIVRSAMSDDGLWWIAAARTHFRGPIIVGRDLQEV